MPHPLRIAVAAIGDPTNPALWSGTPANLVVALRDSGAEVLPVDVRSPYEKAIIDMVALPRVVGGLPTRGVRPGLDRERRAANQSMLLSGARSRAGRHALARHGIVDGVIQIGTGFDIGHANVVSYEDMTVAQALEWPETFWGDVPKHMASARLRQQTSAYMRNRSAAFCTGWAARSAVVQMRCPPAKAHVVGIGTNFAANTHAPRDWSTPRFLFAGREWNRKNGPAVLAAFARVRRNYPDAELHLAGHHPPVDQPGVVAHGHLDLAIARDRTTMERLWATSTCCVVPSRFEPAGIIYVEAMWAGIPAIGTINGGAAEIIGDAGTAVDPYDEDALAAAMLSYCNPQRASDAGARGHSRAEQFSWNRVVRGLLSTLDLTGEHRLKDQPNRST